MKKSVPDGISRNALASGSRLDSMSEPGASALRLIELAGRFATPQTSGAACDVLQGQPRF